MMRTWPVEQQPNDGKRGKHMADRKPFIGDLKLDKELKRLLAASRGVHVTNEDLLEQRISFAYGNAPAKAKSITKESVRKASQHILLKP